MQFDTNYRTRLNAGTLEVQVYRGTVAEAYGATVQAVNATAIGARHRDVVLSDGRTLRNVHRQHLCWRNAQQVRQEQGEALRELLDAI